MKLNYDELLSIFAFSCKLRPAAEGFEIDVKKTSFKANSKALAEKEADGMAKLIYRADTGEILVGRCWSPLL